MQKERAQMKKNLIGMAGFVLMAFVLGAPFVGAQAPGLGGAINVFWVAAPPPAPAATVDSRKILENMGSDVYKVREQASKDLEAALLGGKLTLAQIQEIREAANGKGLGTDPEIRRLAARVFAMYVRRLEDSSQHFKIQIDLDGNASLRYKFRPYTGLLNKENAQEVKDFNQRQKLVQAAFNELPAADTAKAKA